MRRPKFCVVAAVMMVLPLASRLVCAESTLDTINREVSALYERNRDAIVRIHAQRSGSGFPFAPSVRVGTGFLVDADGDLLTSATVVEGAERCLIDWRGRKVAAKLVGLDPRTNLAVLRVAPGDCIGEGEKLPFLVTGNSDEIKTGSMAIAIGYPFDSPSAPSVGFVQGADIRCGNHIFLTSHIRATCRLQPGQGGGPVFNSQGEVIGIAVAAHLDDQCYVLPINAIQRVLTDILRHGAPQYGWVGLSVTERRATPALTSVMNEITLASTAASVSPVVPVIAEPPREVFVEQVYSDTPAAAAGFREQDVLIRIDTNNVRRAADVLNVMFHRRAGDQLNLTIVRSGSTQEVHLVIGQRPAEETPVVEKNTPPRPLDVVPVSASTPYLYRPFTSFEH